MNRDELLNPLFYWLRVGDFKIFATGLSLLLFRLGVFFLRGPVKSFHHTTSRKYQLLLTAVESISCQFCHIRNLFPKVIITVMKNK